MKIDFDQWFNGVWDYQYGILASEWNFRKESRLCIQNSMEYQSERLWRIFIRTIEG